MNTIFLRFLASFSVLLFPFPGIMADAQVTIVVNKGAFPTVEEAAAGEKEVDWSDADLTDDRACTESFAATELARFLPACTSLSTPDIQYAAPGRLPAKGDVFLLGSRRSNRLISSKILPESPDLKTSESFHIYVFRDHDRTITVIEGKDRSGTLYGVYGYLEELGIRFYGLGEQGTVYPPRLSRLPEKMDITEDPSFLTRGFLGLGNRGDKDILYWMARSRLNYCDEPETGIPIRKKLGMMLVKGGHRMQRNFIPRQGEYPYNYPGFTGDEDKPDDPYAPSDEYTGDTNGDGTLTYFEAHPEWYGLLNGKRSEKADIYGGTNFCTSNMDASKELAKNLVQSLIDGDLKNVDIVNFWMLDMGKWCECENCRKQGIYSDRLLDVCYIIQKEIQKAQQEKLLNRQVSLATLAYQETTPPPQHPLPDDFDYDHFSVTYFVIERCYTHAFADPACTEFNQSLLDDYRGWTLGPGRNYKGSIMIGEYYNVSSIKSLPVLYPTIMATDIPYYFKTGTRHMNYMHTPTHEWGTWTLNQYLYARLLWDVDTDTDALLNEYFDRYYPTTSAITRDFYRHLEKAFSNIKAFKHFAGKDQYHMISRLMRDNTEIFARDHLHYEPYHPELNDGLDIVEMIDELGYARKAIDEALLRCTDKTEQSRLIDDDRRFAYGEAMVQFYYRLIRTALSHRHAETIMAKHEFRKVEKYAETLRHVTDLVAPLPGFASGDANSANGLEASQAVRVYNYFKERYGEKE